MSTLSDLYALVNDSTIGSDAWGDYFLDEAVVIVNQIKKAGDLQTCLNDLHTFSEISQSRLLQALTSVETREIFPSLINILKNSPPEPAEVIVDNLRSWQLSSQELQELFKVTEQFRGKWSVLLDHIIDTGKF